MFGRILSHSVLTPPYFNRASAQSYAQSCKVLVDFAPLCSNAPYFNRETAQSYAKSCKVLVDFAPLCSNAPLFQQGRLVPARNLDPAAPAWPSGLARCFGSAAGKDPGSNPRSAISVRIPVREPRRTAGSRPRQDPFRSCRGRRLSGNFCGKFNSRRLTVRVKGILQLMPKFLPEQQGLHGNIRLKRQRGYYLYSRQCIARFPCLRKESTGR